eukprot:TRINITY_DN2440_c0_g1_i1.p1 TRINITY_DN2440_c0_g1~~TRINITY_DN2440_c0_g1_i1.p1  ORF type:complete len:919 (-),score=219.08 TRINITY_DN2440_c0_g1_i1:195-2918(-)
MSTFLLALAILAMVLFLSTPGEAAIFHEVEGNTTVLHARSGFSFLPFFWFDFFNFFAGYGHSEAGGPDFQWLRLPTGNLPEYFPNTTKVFVHKGFRLDSHQEEVSPDDIPEDLQYGSATYFFDNTTTTPLAKSIFTGGLKQDGSVLQQIQIKSYAQVTNGDGSVGVTTANSKLPLNNAVYGHTAFFAETSLTTFHGYIILIGGHTGTAYVDFFVTISLNSDSNGATVGTAKPVVNGPPLRKHHAGLSFGSKRQQIIIWGGENDSSYFNDGPWIVTVPDNLDNSFTWTLKTPANSPPARSGHTLTFLAGNSNIMYMFGGHDATQTFNDLWSYTISSNTWTDLSVNTPGQPQPLARAFHQALPYDDETFVVYGGIDSSGADLNLLEFVSPNEPCPSYCSRGDAGYCMTPQECDNFVECSWDSAHPFQCHQDCISNPSLCSYEYSCQSTEVRCWNGQCSPSGLASCPPVPACNAGEKRCSDGDCYAFSASCTGNSVACASGLTKCYDGSCAAECPRFFGCAADENNHHCYDGSCASSETECNTLYPLPYAVNYEDGSTGFNITDSVCGGGQVRCSAAFNTCSDPSLCEKPLPFTQIHDTQVIFGSGSSDIYYLYPKQGELDLDDTIGFMYVQNFPEDINVQALITSADSSNIDEIFSPPRSEYLQDNRPSAFLRSTPVDLISVGVDQAYQKAFEAGTSAQSLGVLFKMHLDEPTYELGFNVSYNHGYAYVQTYYCFGEKYEWYWDVLDLEPGAFGDYPFMQEYRDIFNETVSGVLTEDEKIARIDAIDTPPYRWRCIPNEVKQNVPRSECEPEGSNPNLGSQCWPQGELQRNNAGHPSDDKWFGIRMVENMNGTFAILGLRSNEALVSDPPAAVFDPSSPEGHYLALGTAVVLFVGLIGMVIFKTFRQRA